MRNKQTPFEQANKLTHTALGGFRDAHASLVEANTLLASAEDEAKQIIADRTLHLSDCARARLENEKAIGVLADMLGLTPAV